MVRAVKCIALGAILVVAVMGACSRSEPKEIHPSSPSLYDAIANNPPDIELPEGFALAALGGKANDVDDESFTVNVFVRSPNDDYVLTFQIKPLMKHAEEQFDELPESLSDPGGDETIVGPSTVEERDFGNRRVVCRTSQSGSEIECFAHEGRAIIRAALDGSSHREGTANVLRLLRAASEYWADLEATFLNGSETNS